MSYNWSPFEVHLIVSDYFNMLTAELKGLPYSKAEHRRSIIPLLQNRSEGSIEFKHQNISAVLIELGQPYIKGYLPRFNYQTILKDAILEYLSQNLALENQFSEFSEKEVHFLYEDINFSKFVVDPPIGNLVGEPKLKYNRRPFHINYLEREQKNSKLGLIGEEIVIEFEKWNLIIHGKEKLAEQIRWISKEEGDGAGFDILSKNLNGSDKYIEVKTTKLTKETPIYFSKNELDFSIENSYNFHLYRVFNVEEQARMFMRTGSLNQICKAIPMSYKGYF